MTKLRLPPQMLTSFYNTFSVFFSLLFILVSLNTGYSKGGVQGTISSVDEGVLPYASIYVKQLGTGTTANENGYYEISLEPGRYELVFQFLSYETVVRIIEVTDIVLELNVTLKPQSLLLNEIIVGANQEDPA